MKQGKKSPSSTDEPYGDERSKGSSNDASYNEGEDEQARPLIQ
jgi:hypothetical protein